MNTSVRNVGINSLQSDNGNDLPVLGRLFLSSAYIMVNHEAKRFFVWPVNTEAKAADTVAVDKDNNLVNDFCVKSTSPSATPSATPSITPSPRNDRSKLSGGAVAGIVVGAVGGIATMSAIGFCFYRRGRYGNGVTQEPKLQTADAKLMVPTEPQELPRDQYNANELDGRAADNSRH